jgi:phosphoribosyl 1,2-cyclic phosphodiesterase
MRVVSLASGSSGNALLVEAGARRRTKLLIDAGISSRQITERLLSVGVHPAQLTGILITHEHRDHVQGLPILLKRFNLSIITAPQTYQAIEESIATGIWRTDSGTGVSIQSTLMAEPDNSARDPERLQSSTLTALEDRSHHFLSLEVGANRRLGDIEITSFPISHDAVAPCGYLLQAGGCRVCVVTDSGEVTPEMLTHIQHADLLVLEANHDRQQLIRGPYPNHLKQRILSPLGHLSNDQTTEAVLHTWRTDSVRWLWLSHLSRTNNTPALAIRSVRSNLQAAGANLSQVHLSVSPPGMGPTWDSTQLWATPTLWETPY